MRPVALLGTRVAAALNSLGGQPELHLPERPPRTAGLQDGDLHRGLGVQGPQSELGVGSHGGRRGRARW